MLASNAFARDVAGECVQIERDRQALFARHGAIAFNLSPQGFIMRLRDETLVNNAVPLCQTCNRSKTDMSYKDFYNRAEVAGLLAKNAVLTSMLNENTLLDSAGNVIKVGSPF